MKIFHETIVNNVFSFCILFELIVGITVCMGVSKRIVFIAFCIAAAQLYIHDMTETVLSFLTNTQKSIFFRIFNCYILPSKHFDDIRKSNKKSRKN